MLTIHITNNNPLQRKTHYTLQRTTHYKEQITTNYKYQKKKKNKQTLQRTNNTLLINTISGMCIYFYQMKTYINQVYQKKKKKHLKRFRYLPTS